MTEREKREKIINDLAYLVDNNVFDDDPIMEYGIDGCFKKVNVRSTLKDILVLLKAQEPVKPLRTHIGSTHEKYLCGECGGSFFRHMVSYCPWCGREVKWDD